MDAAAVRADDSFLRTYNPAMTATDELNEIAAEAQREEFAGNAIRAALIWQRALPLLPPGSDGYQWVTRRIGALTSNMAPPSAPLGYESAARPGVRPPDALPIAIA